HHDRAHVARLAAEGAAPRRAEEDDSLLRRAALAAGRAGAAAASADRRRSDVAHPRAPGRVGVAGDHPGAELGVFLGALRWARVVRLDAAVLGREAERQRDVEALERAHLAIEPAVGAGAEAVGPAEAGAQVAHPE